MALNIPMPQLFNADSLSNIIQEGRLSPYKMALMKAQAEQAQGTAAKSQMLARLINHVMGGGGAGGIGGGSGGGGGPEADLAAALLGIPVQHQVIDGKVVTFNPLIRGGGSTGSVSPAATNAPIASNRPANQPGMKSLKEQVEFFKNNAKPGDEYVLQNPSAPQTQVAPQSSMGQPQVSNGMRVQQVGETPQEKTERENEAAYTKELANTDIKQMGKWGDTIAASHAIKPVLETIRDTIAEPALQDMYKNPEYFGYDLQYLKRFGTPAQQELLTTLGTSAKSIFQSMSSEFKGAFREFELNLFNKAAPDELKDTLPQLIGKTNTMMALRDLASRRLTLADNIVRTSRGKISPNSALEIADRQIGASKVRDEIKQNFQKIQAEKKKSYDESILKNNKTTPDKTQGLTTIIDPNGGEHVIYKKNLNAALAKYPGSKEKKEASNAAT